MKVKYCFTSQSIAGNHALFLVIFFTRNDIDSGYQKKIYDTECIRCVHFFYTICSSEQQESITDHHSLAEICQNLIFYLNML